MAKLFLYFINLKYPKTYLYGKVHFLLRKFGFWFCEDCQKLHSPSESIYTVRDNDFFAIDDKRTFMKR
jgi:hypothetical protein